MNAPPPENLRPISFLAERLFSCYVFCRVRSLFLFLSSFPSFPFSLSLSIFVDLSVFPSTTREFRERKRAGPDQLATERTRWFSLPVSPSPLSLQSPSFPGPRPALRASSKFRLEIIKLHALTRTCVVRTDGPLSRQNPFTAIPSALSLSRPSMTLVELSTRVIPRILACVRARGGGCGGVGASTHCFPGKIDDDRPWRAKGGERVYAIIGSDTIFHASSCILHSPQYSRYKTDCRSAVFRSCAR